MTIESFEGIKQLSLVVTILVVIGVFCYLWYLYVNSCANGDNQNTQKPNYYHHEPKKEEPKREIKEEPKVYDYTPPTQETEFPHINERREPSYKNSTPYYHIRERISYGFDEPKKETTYSHTDEQTETVKEKSYTPLFIQEEINRLREEPKKSFTAPRIPIIKKTYIPPSLPKTVSYSVDTTGKRNITKEKLGILLLDEIGIEPIQKLQNGTVITINGLKRITQQKSGRKYTKISTFMTVEITKEKLLELNNSNEMKQHERNKVTPKLREIVKVRDNYTCQICGKHMPDNVGLHIDHIIPINKGGKSVVENLQVLCSVCNGRKSDKVEGE